MPHANLVQRFATHYSSSVEVAKECLEANDYNWEKAFSALVDMMRNVWGVAEDRLPLRRMTPDELKAEKARIIEERKGDKDQVEEVIRNVMHAATVRRIVEPAFEKPPLPELPDDYMERGND